MPAKLVVIGDSLSQGFQSASIFNTRLSYPTMIASALSDVDFRFPEFSGEGGLPVNLEKLFRLLGDRFGPDINLLELVPAVGTVNSFLDRVEDYWERGKGTLPTGTGPLHHNLAVWGFSVGDADTLTEGLCRRVIPPPQDNLPLLQQVTEWPMYRTARRTLNPSFSSAYENLSQLDAAQTIVNSNSGIDNLIVWLGANNCLDTVTSLKIRWSQPDDFDRLAFERTCNLWRPEHFRTLYQRIAAKIDAFGAKNVYVGTVPHVTIPPVSRGISPGATEGEERDAEGYYQFYTHFWVWDDDFARAPHKYPYLTGSDARVLDQTVDAYNEIIRTEANARGWHVVDLCKTLDELAFRRQGGKPRYQFPPELVAALKQNHDTKHRFDLDGRPILDTRYLRKSKNPDGSTRYQGGLVSLDGIHPTTIGYGITAYEFLKVMNTVTPTQPLNWPNIIEADQLVRRLPNNLENLRSILGFVFSQSGMKNMIRQLGSGMAARAA